MIVQPLEHVALIYHCHASQCVLINFWKAHTHTHLITDKAGGHIPDSEHRSNKHTHRKTKHLLIFTRQYFEPRTLVRRQWKLDIRTFLWSCFCKTFWKIALHVGSKYCLDQIKLLDQLLVWAELGFVLLDNYWHSHLKRRSYILLKQRRTPGFISYEWTKPVEAHAWKRPNA